MRYLVTADLHFASGAEYAYRFEIFDFISRVIREYRVDAVFILGDLTEAKDKHSSFLVNKVVDGLCGLTKTGLRYGVKVLKGNHDFVDSDSPFFGFIKHIEGLDFICEPTRLVNDIILLPYSDNPVMDWEDITYAKRSLAMMHQSVLGARAYNGYKLEKGLTLGFLESKFGQVISGDIHTPQEMGNLVYVGSPHSVHFGEHHRPRVIVGEYKDGGTNFGFVYNDEAPTNWAVHLRDDQKLEDSGYNFKPEDRIKIHLYLDQNDLYRWKEHRKVVLESCERLQLNQKGLTVHTTKPKLETKEKAKPEVQEIDESLVQKSTPKVFYDYCENNDIDGVLKDTGSELVKWYLKKGQNLA